MSLEKSTAATAFPGCDELGYQSDNDTDLVVHYPFQNNGEDILDTNGDGRYDMVNTNGTMQYTPGCATGQSLYIDSTSGVMLNDNFTDTNLGGNIASGNFTISFWTVRDGDMVKFSSAVNTGYKGTHARQATGVQKHNLIWEVVEKCVGYHSMLQLLQVAA